MSPAELELYAALSRAMHEAHVVGGLSVGGADLADDGSRACECQRARSSRLVEVVTQAVQLAGREGVDPRRAIRDAALVARGQS